MVFRNCRPPVCIIDPTPLGPVLDQVHQLWQARVYLSVAPQHVGVDDGQEVVDCDVNTGAGGRVHKLDHRDASLQEQKGSADANTTCY
jgi:hypothetical protein